MNDQANRAELYVSGVKYGMLTLIRHDSGSLCQNWVARCDCGVEKIICAYDAKRGRVKSCGCIIYSASKYDSYHPLKICWYGLVGRHGYEKMCAKWQNFEGFVDDMGEGFQQGYRIHRINKLEIFSRENCCWKKGSTLIAVRANINIDENEYKEPASSLIRKRKDIFVEIASLESKIIELRNDARKIGDALSVFGVE